MIIWERAANSNWILNSSEVEKLIGVRPRVDKDKRSFTRGCWSFIKTGKIGQESGWKVIKVIKGIKYKGLAVMGIPIDPLIILEKFRARNSVNSRIDKPGN